MQCPGQDSRFWGLNAILRWPAPVRQGVEFLRMSPPVRAKDAGLDRQPQMDFGCASYCQFRQQCVGRPAG